jgi:site-specific recombinase XerD
MERTYDAARSIVRAAQGPLASHLDAFVSWLIEQRYSGWCVHLKAYRAADFSAWLARRRIDVRGAEEQNIASYHRERSRRRHRPWRNELYALRQLLGFLRERGVLDAPAPATPIAPWAAYVQRFEEHLHHVRGLSARTVELYAAFAQRFMDAQFGVAQVELRNLAAADVIAFVQIEAQRLSPPRAKLLTTALRSFLCHAQLCGDVDAGIVAAVPTVSSWSVAPQLPRAISAEHARAALQACDLRTAVGRRDRAVLLLLARLGLRSGEVAALTLDDIDWAGGVLRVRGKGAREALLPLPVDVGQAVAAYLQNGRPAADDRRVFLRSRAPIRGFGNDAVAIGSIVMHALERAGVDAPRKGAHQFRHALAVRMLGNGASLPEIGEVLRHRSPQTTALYARVDLVALRELAARWPGVTP